MGKQMSASGVVLLAGCLLASLCTVSGRLIDDKKIPEPEFVGVMSWAKFGPSGDEREHRDTTERRELVQQAVCVDVYPRYCALWGQRYCSPGWRFAGRDVGQDLCRKTCKKCPPTPPPRRFVPRSPVRRTPILKRSPAPIMRRIPAPPTSLGSTPVPAPKTGGGSVGSRAGTIQSLVQSDYPQKLLALVNQGRAENGKPPLCLNLKLMQSALKKSEDMAKNNYFAHDAPSGVSPWDLIKGAGYTGMGMAENIAAGYNTVERVYQGWKDSPGHWANILGDFDHMGIGLIENPAYRNMYGDYWTQHFGKSTTETCSS